METVLVAFDDSDPAHAASTGRSITARGAKLGCSLCTSYLGSRKWELEAFQVNTDALRDNVGRLLQSRWSEPLRQAGIDHEARLLVGRPAEEILRCADEEDVSLIVLGLTSKGTLFDLLAHSAVERVLHRSQRPVVAVPGNWKRDSGSTH